MKYPRKPKYPLNCTICDKQFFVYKYRLKTAKFCGYPCYAKSLIGSHLSEKTKKQISEFRKLHPVSTIFKKGYIPWNKGSKILQITGNNHWNWKGNKVSYRGLHFWVERYLGKPSKCSKCGKTGKGREIHWANISGKYKRDVNDWIRLCAKCHGIFDSN